MVHPYRKEADLVMTDAFRGPMASAFKLHLEDIMLFTDSQRFVLAKESTIIRGARWWNLIERYGPENH